jgi:hypothetical protein
MRRWKTLVALRLFEAIETVPHPTPSYLSCSTFWCGTQFRRRGGLGLQHEPPLGLSGDSVDGGAFLLLPPVMEH